MQLHLFIHADSYSLTRAIFLGVFFLAFFFINDSFSNDDDFHLKSFKKITAKRKEKKNPRRIDYSRSD